MTQNIWQKDNYLTFIEATSHHRTEIMRVSMLAVILFHQYFTSAIPFNFFHFFGYWGVDVFLFLSGMGIVNSIKKYPTSIYFKRRFTRILPSCILCGTLKYIIFNLFGTSIAVLKEGLNICILSMVGLDSWYIYTILIFYAIAPLLYIIIQKAPLITIICIAFLYIINGLTVRPMVGFDWMSPEGILGWTIERLPVFTCGMMISIWKSLDRKILTYSFIFLILAIILKLLEKLCTPFPVLQVCIMMTLAIGMPSLIFITIFFLQYTPQVLKAIFSFFGTYSLEIYLVHGFIFWALKIIYACISPWLLMPIAFILTCLSAYFCKKIVDKMTILRGGLYKNAK